jgi:hypothetical protein
MFPQQNMDRLLQLKLEILYKDLPIEQARQRFEDLKQLPPSTNTRPVVVYRPVVRIPAAQESK